MKRRITFIYETNSHFDPKQLDVETNALQVRSLKAAREERWTTNLYDLPQELWLALKQVHELHVRWASSTAPPSIAPFISTVPPGLHVLLTPQKYHSADRLCPALSKIFGGSLNCTLPEDVFTRTPIIAERFASSASLQYYEYTPSIVNLIAYLQEKICPKSGQTPTCRTDASSLARADYVDIDYDTISQSLQLHVFWHAPPTDPVWNEKITQLDTRATVEIGILANEKATKPEDISLGGYLVTLGEDKKSKPTLFSFPSRHHLQPFPSNYTTTFTRPTGLHPTLRLTFPTSLRAPTNSPSCALHTYLTLPSTLFPDKYQLSQPNLLSSNNLASLRSLSPPAPDLEAPSWTTQEWGSALLVELAPPSSPPSNPQVKEWHADIPLHLRYLPPSAESAHRPITVPNPVVFWACASNHEGPEMDTNPFDRTNLGYDGLFGPRTLFYHLQASPGEGVQRLQAPVLDLREAGWVEGGTGLAVLVGSAWVVWCLLRVALWGGKVNANVKGKKNQ